MKTFLICLLLLISFTVFTCDWNRGFVQEEPSMSDLVGLWEAGPFSDYDKKAYEVSGRMHFRLNEDGTISDGNFYYKPPRRDILHITGGGKWRLRDANPDGRNKHMVLRWEIVLYFDDEPTNTNINIPIKRIHGKTAFYYALIFDTHHIPFFKKEDEGAAGGVN